jgi:hypothetical protein
MIDDEKSMNSIRFARLESLFLAKKAEGSSGLADQLAENEGGEHVY